MLNISVIVLVILELNLRSFLSEPVAISLDGAGLGQTSNQSRIDPGFLKVNQLV